MISNDPNPLVGMCQRIAACSPVDDLGTTTTGSRCGSLQNLIFEGDALWVVFLEPFFCGVHIGEDLDVIDVADLLAGVDVDKDGCHRITLYFLAGFLRGSGADSVQFGARAPWQSSPS